MCSSLTIPMQLIQEKSELREEKATLKSDIEILNAQYQHRVRSMVPWIPHYNYPIPVVAISQGQPTFLPYSASDSPLTEYSSSSGASNKQDSKSMSLDQGNDHKDDVGLELGLKIHDSSSAQHVSDFFNSFANKLFLCCYFVFIH